MTRRFYNRNGLPEKVIRPNEYEICGDHGAGYRYTYDLQGRLQTVTGPDGHVLLPKADVPNDGRRDERGSKSGRTTIPSQQQMHDAVTQWARMEESLANSNRQLDKFNTATVVYDARTGNYYYGMNRGVQLSGDTLNSSLASWLPESSLNQYRLGNCAEVDTVNQALNSGANASDLYLYTINTKNNVVLCQDLVQVKMRNFSPILTYQKLSLRMCSFVYPFKFIW